jgi:tellurite resistance protein TerC
VLLAIGGKMIANGLYGPDFVPTEAALLVTAILIGGSILLSLLRPAAAEASTGWVPGTARPEDSSARKKEVQP